jgi:Leucine-rich repeat (LRR) protein
MAKINIENYLNSLPEDTKEIKVTFQGLTYLPDLSRFKKLIHLYCDGNKLTSLPKLPNKLTKLYCQDNKLTSLPQLPEKLVHLECHHNQLTSLPELPKKMTKLYCNDNKLTSLPELPKNLKTLDCCYNNLNSLPELPKKLCVFNCYHNNLWFIPSFPDNCFNILDDNPIYDVLTKGDRFAPYYEVNKNIKILNNFHKSYKGIQYALKLKQQFRHWLWVRVREPKIKEKYNPRYLSDLKDEDDLDTFLGDLGWIDSGNNSEKIDKINM